MKQKHSVRGFLAGALTMALAVGLFTSAGAVLTGKTIEVLTGAEIYIDGVKLEPTDANGNPVETFVYNGTTYVPLRAVSQSLGKAVNWDGEDQRVYIGETPGMKQYLNTVCPPYQSENYSNPTTVDMAGQKYSNVIFLNNNWSYYYDGWALYNLNAQYDLLRFTVGHVDGYGMTESTLNIYLDDQLAFSMDLNPNDLPETVEVPLHNALKMKIEMTEGCYALGEVEIY